MVRRLLVQAVVLCVFCAHAQTYPPPPAATTAESNQIGQRIQRTMSLLATSPASRKQEVRVLIYGQSISKQDWCRPVATWIKATYPNANVIVRNWAIGGCASSCLVAPSEHDIYPFYPDLVIFHVYGSHYDYDTIVRKTRSLTTAEMLLQTDHYTGADSWSDQMSSTLIPAIANTYHAGLANIRAPWQRYLNANSYQPSQCLSDAVHLNAQGNYLMAELIKRNLAYKSTLARDPDSLVKEYHVGADASWSANKLTMRFAGNRIDLVIDPSAIAGRRAEVRIDGQRPSSIPSLYTFGRPNGAFGAEWIESPQGKDWPWETGAIMRVTSSTPRLVEDWTVTITRWVSASNFSFSVSGSKTGADGGATFNSSSTFRSTSGRVMIQPTDWWVTNLIDTAITVGHTIKWSVTPHFVDTAVVPQMSDATREYTITLAQFLTNADHTLELTSLEGASIPIAGIRVYRPYYGRSPTSVPNPQPVALRPEAPVAASVAPQNAGTVASYNLHGQRVAGSRDARRSAGLVLETGLTPVKHLVRTVIVR